ncbi:DUF3489 domain-containing protein [Hydrogenophaga sp.]|uniref:DUF3489 domain-containing protein n=1 Tax=Hydrogenophaga sp. TaxID=1904254 RepID=UPI0035AF07B0
MKRNASTPSKLKTVATKSSARKPNTSTRKPTSNPKTSGAKTAAGRSKAPAVKASPAASVPPAAPESAATSTEPSSLPAQSKQAQLIALLRSDPGATMAQMIALTGWQRHTVRGMISGSLRKRLGLDVQQRSIDGVRVYRIVEDVAP